MLQRIYASALPVITPYLKYIFNASSREASFPMIWEMSMIAVINEVKSPAQPGDYRSISILYDLCKVLKKLDSLQVCSFIQKKPTRYSKTFNLVIGPIAVLK